MKRVATAAGILAVTTAWTRPVQIKGAEDAIRRAETMKLSPEARALVGEAKKPVAQAISTDEPRAVDGVGLAPGSAWKNPQILHAVHRIPEERARQEIARRGVGASASPTTCPASLMA